MIWRAMSRPVRPFAARTREYCANVLCTFHCAQNANAMAGMRRRNVGSLANGKNMWGRLREVVWGTAEATADSSLFDAAACGQLSGGCKTGQPRAASANPE